MKKIEMGMEFSKYRIDQKLNNLKKSFQSLTINALNV